MWAEGQYQAGPLRPPLCPELTPGFLCSQQVPSLLHPPKTDSRLPTGQPLCWPSPQPLSPAEVLL